MNLLVCGSRYPGMPGSAPIGIWLQAGWTGATTHAQAKKSVTSSFIPLRSTGMFNFEILIQTRTDTGRFANAKFEPAVESNALSRPVGRLYIDRPVSPT